MAMFSAVGDNAPRHSQTPQVFPDASSHSQSFSVVLSRSQSCEATCCQSGADVVPSRSLAGWGCTWTYIPIQTNELGAADVPLSRQGRCALITPSYNAKPTKWQSSTTPPPSRYLPQTYPLAMPLCELRQRGSAMRCSRRSSRQQPL